MRLNQYLAQGSNLSRRAADRAIADGRVLINNKPAVTGQTVAPGDMVRLDGHVITPAVNKQLIIINKPVGFVCSRDGQGSRTIYELLPRDLQNLNTVGRLDKNSSGLLLLTNDGQLAYELTHPKFKKTKVYKIALNKPLSPEHLRKVREGVMLNDGISKLQAEHISPTDFTNWKITMHEGRNRQIRRTFEALGYSIPKLHRTQFGQYSLGSVKTGTHQILK